MFDLIRNLTKSEAEKRQEMASAYLDNALSPAEQRRFEQLLADDPALQASVSSQRLIKQQLRQLPRVAAPRNFTLDPALYGRPQSRTSARLFPAVRFATAAAGILLMVLLVTDLLLVSNAIDMAPAGEQVAFEAQEAPAEEALKQATPTLAESAQAEMEMAAEGTAAEEPAAEEAVAGEAAADSAVAEEAVEAPMVEAPAEAMPYPAPETDLSALATGPAGGAPLPTPSPAGTVEGTPAALGMVAEDSAAGRSITGTEVQGPQTQILTTSPPSVDEGSEAVEPINLLRLIEIGLLLAVILLAGLSLYLRRQR